MNSKRPSIEELEERLVSLRGETSQLTARRGERARPPSSVHGEQIPSALSEQLRFLDALRVEAELLLKSNLPGLTGEEGTIELTLPTELRARREIAPSLEETSLEEILAEHQESLEFSLEFSAEVLVEERELELTATPTGHPIALEDRSGLAEEGVQEIVLIADELPTERASLSPREGQRPWSAPPREASVLPRQTAVSASPAVRPPPEGYQVRAALFDALSPPTPRLTGLSQPPPYLLLAQEPLRSAEESWPWLRREEISWREIGYTPARTARPEAPSRPVSDELLPAEALPQLQERRQITLRLDENLPGSEAPTRIPVSLDELEGSYGVLEASLSALGEASSESPVPSAPEPDAAQPERALESDALPAVPSQAPAASSQAERAQADRDEAALRERQGELQESEREALEALIAPAMTPVEEGPSDDFGWSSGAAVSVQPAAAALDDPLDISAPPSPVEESRSAEERITAELARPPETSEVLRELLESEPPPQGDASERSTVPPVGELDDPVAERRAPRTLQLQSVAEGSSAAAGVASIEELRETQELPRSGHTPTAPPLSERERQALEALELDAAAIHSLDEARQPEPPPATQTLPLAARSVEQTVAGDTPAESALAEGLGSPKSTTDEASPNREQKTTAPPARGELRLLDFADFFAGEGEAEEEFFDWSAEPEDRSLFSTPTDALSSPQESTPTAAGSPARGTQRQAPAPAPTEAPASAEGESKGLFRRLFKRK